MMVDMRAMMNICERSDNYDDDLKQQRKINLQNNNNHHAFERKIVERMQEEACLVAFA